MEVCILGGGYAGVVLTRELEDRLDSDVCIRLFDNSGVHLMQHEIHRLIRFPALQSTIEIPLETLVRRAEAVKQEVTSVDVANHSFTTADNREYHPDFLAVCLGATTATYDISGIKTHGFVIKESEDALAIRNAARDISQGGTIVIGGAGLSGIQVAGELAGFREDCHLVLVEQKPNVAPGLPHSFQDAVREQLESSGVTVKINTEIHRATETKIEMVGRDSISYELFVWAGGIRGTPALRQRPVVHSDLRATPHTFVIGDAASVVDDLGSSVPDSAQTAIAQAKVTARNIDRLIRASRDCDRIFEPRLDRYVHDIPGWVVSVGDDAVAYLHGTTYTGKAANGVKIAAGVRYLTKVGRITESLELLTSEFDRRPAKST